MTSEPDMGLWIQCRHIMVEVFRGIVIPVLLSDRSTNAGRIAGIRGRLTPASLVGKPRVFAAAASEEQIVVDLIVRGGATLEERDRGAFETYDDGGVLRIGENMATEPITFPTEVLRVIEAAFDILPVSSIWFLHVCVGGNPSHGQNGTFVGDIGTGYLINGPG